MRPVRCWSEPGVAVDQHGRTLLLATDTQLPVTLDVDATAYISIQSVEEPVRPQSAWDGEEHATRVLERARLTVERHGQSRLPWSWRAWWSRREIHDAEKPTNPGQAKWTCASVNVSWCGRGLDLAVGQLY